MHINRHMTHFEYSNLASSDSGKGFCKLLISTFTVLIWSLLLLSSASVSAEQWVNPRDKVKTTSSQLQYFNENMSPKEYKDAYHHNRKILIKTVASYSKHVLMSIDTPETVVNAMGAAIAVATQDTKLHLNESDTMSLAFKDIATENRSIFFRIEMDW